MAKPRTPSVGPDDPDADLRIDPDDPDAPNAGGDATGEASLTDELDLHTFVPRECADVVAEYVRARLR